MSFFDFYWKTLGLPLSRLKGTITDAIPFSVVEMALWTGILASVLFIISFILKPPGFRIRLFRRCTFVLGPTLLVVLSLGQGAFPFTIAPTALRTPLPERLGIERIDEDTFLVWAALREARLQQNARFPAWDYFRTFDERTVLRRCDGSLDTVLAGLGLPPGRTVRNVKDMGPLTTRLGLVYGGPAFHDPLFGELAVIRERDLPAPLHWRLIAACHEAAHAKGFTREMDAEILTQLALARIPDPGFEILADIHFLQKSGLTIEWPDSLRAEVARIREARLKVEAQRPFVTWMRDRVRALSLDNDPAKYGVRRPDEAWNPAHPFFGTLRTAAERLAEDPAGLGEHDGT